MVRFIHSHAQLSTHSADKRHLVHKRSLLRITTRWRVQHDIHTFRFTERLDSSRVGGAQFATHMVTPPGQGTQLCCYEKAAGAGASTRGLEHAYPAGLGEHEHMRRATAMASPYAVFPTMKDDVALVRKPY